MRAFPSKQRRKRSSGAAKWSILSEQRRRRREKKAWSADMDISRHSKAGSVVDSFETSAPSARVAVIGGGASGLVALRYCLAAGMDTLLFEEREGIGGVWRMQDPDKSSGHHESHATRKKTNAMYRDLVTNLPKEIMAFFDFPFKPEASSFVSHREVLSYLYEYAYYHQLMEHVRCNKRVVRIWPVDKDSTTDCDGCGEELAWMVETFDEFHRGHTTIHRFDAVIVANGHYNDPFVPQIPGLEHFPGRIMHSIAFEDGGDFRGKHVLVLGAKASGTDIAMILKSFASAVTVCDRGIPEDLMTISGKDDRVDWRPPAASISIEGHIVLADDSIVREVDVIMFCTGYRYSFPFIDSAFQKKFQLVHPSGRAVQHLHRHCFFKPCPSLSFVGLPYSVVPFPLAELQSRWIAAVFAGLCDVPEFNEKESSPDGMTTMEHPSSYHLFGPKQWEYCDFLLSMVADGTFCDSDEEIAAVEYSRENPTHEGDNSLPTVIHSYCKQVHAYLVANGGSDELKVVGSEVPVPQDLRPLKLKTILERSSFGFIFDGMLGDVTISLPQSVSTCNGDTHFTKCRSVPLVAQMQQQVLVNRDIYNHVSAQRPKWPGGDANYRSVEYRIQDLSSATWQILGPDETFAAHARRTNTQAGLVSVSSHVAVHISKKKNLFTKMKNIESQLSTVPTPKQWKECLGGILRCALWWQELYPEIEDLDESKTYSLMLWMLVQHVMQCGPLLNSKPAYFKRTTTEVIQEAVTFLLKIQHLGAIGLSEAQQGRLVTWIKGGNNQLAKMEIKVRSNGKKTEQQAQAGK